MSRVLAAHQPNYLPWLGLFYKLAQADVWVIGDDVQYTRQGLTNRNRIRTAEGWQWLTVPVCTRGRGLQAICEVEVDTSRTWQRKHWQALQWNYHKAPFFADHAQFLEGFYQRPWHNLVELNVVLCRYILQQFGLELEIRRSSEMDLRAERTLRLVDMALACECDVYLAGTGGSRAYLDEEAFSRLGIECRFSEFRHPIYPQCFPGFEPNMTALDMLMNCGETSREVLLER
jgi:hypothetical protein